MKSPKRNPVYSTRPGFADRCPRCGANPCRCRLRTRPRSLPPEGQTAHIQREKKGRGGKTVTVVRNLQLTPTDLEALTRQLKETCGAGGAVKDGAVEIQGDQRDRVAAELQRMGYKTKFIGG